MVYIKLTSTAESFVSAFILYFGANEQKGDNNNNKQVAIKSHAKQSDLLQPV